MTKTATPPSGSSHHSAPHVVEIDAMDVAEWESGQSTPQANDANMAELVRRSASTPEAGPKTGRQRAQTAALPSGLVKTMARPTGAQARTTPPKAAPKPVRARTEVAFAATLTPPAGTTTAPAKAEDDDLSIPLEIEDAPVKATELTTAPAMPAPVIPALPATPAMGAPVAPSRSAGTPATPAKGAAMAAKSAAGAPTVKPKSAGGGSGIGAAMAGPAASAIGSSAMAPMGGSVATGSTALPANPVPIAAPVIPALGALADAGAFSVQSDVFETATATYGAPARSLAKSSSPAPAADSVVMPVELRRDLARASSPSGGTEAKIEAKFEAKIEANRTWLPLPAPSEPPSEPHRLVPEPARRAAPGDRHAVEATLLGHGSPFARPSLDRSPFETPPPERSPFEPLHTPGRLGLADGTPPPGSRDQVADAPAQLSVSLTRRRLVWIIGALSAISLGVVVVAAVIRAPGDRAAAAEGEDAEAPGALDPRAAAGAASPGTASPGSADVARPGSSGRVRGAQAAAAGDRGTPDASTQDPSRSSSAAAGRLMAATSAAAAAPAGRAAQPRRPTSKRVVLDYSAKPSDPPPPGLVAQTEEDPAIGRARRAYTMGNQRLFAGDLNGAIEAYYQALDFYPGYVGGYRGLGLAYAQMGVNVRAIDALKTYVEAAPNARDVALIKKRIARLQGK